MLLQKQLIGVVQLNSMKINSLYSFLYLAIYLSVYVNYFEYSNFAHLYFLVGMLVYIIWYLVALILKKNDTTIFSMFIVGMIFGQVRGAFISGSKEYYWFFAFQFIFLLIVILDFLFIREDIPRSERFKRFF